MVNISKNFGNKLVRLKKYSKKNQKSLKSLKQKRIRKNFVVTLQRARSVFKVTQIRKIQRGEVKGVSTRLDKLATLFMRAGKRLKVVNSIYDLRIKVKEAFKVYSSAFFIENILERLEPLFDLRKPVARKRGRNRSGSKDKVELVPYPCTLKRRTYLGLGFFRKAVNLRQKKYQIKLATAMFHEIRAIHLGLRCFSFDFKKEHLVRVLAARRLRRNRSFAI